MKQSNRECKIVRDLLPSYIDDLTDEVTNEFINEHIGDCPECAKFLSQMNGDIKLDVINQEKEIKYLKKIRRRVKQTIAIVSLIVIIVAACAVGYVYNKSKIQVNNYTFLRAEFIDEDKEGIDGKIYCTLIAVIDEKGICKSVRIVEEGYKEDVIKQKFEEMQKNFDERNLMDIDIENKKLHYNINIWNGCTKEEVKKKWINSYEKIVIEEI